MASTDRGDVPKFEDISYQLQNPKSEQERMGAYAALLSFMEAHPDHKDAYELHSKYNRLERDWTKEIKSPSP